MPDLFDFAFDGLEGVPNVRAADPESSLAAAGEMDRAGARRRQAACALGLVRRHPGSTALELLRAAAPADLAALGGQPRHAVSRRLPELRALGLVRNGAQRACRVNGRLMLTWEPAEPAAAKPREAT